MAEVKEGGRAPRFTLPAINLDTTQVETLSQWLTAQWPTA